MKYFGLMAMVACCFVLAYSTQPLSAGSLQGYVYDSLTSLPIDSAHVDGVCLDTTAEFHKITDLNGFYSATNLPNGRWQVTASHPDYYSRTKQVNVPYAGRNLNFYLPPRNKEK